MGELAQELANKLGLKIRKAYVSPQVCDSIETFFLLFTAEWTLRSYLFDCTIHPDMDKRVHIQSLWQMILCRWTQVWLGLKTMVMGLHPLVR